MLSPPKPAENRPPSDHIIPIRLFPDGPYVVDETLRLARVQKSRLRAHSQLPGWRPRTARITLRSPPTGSGWVGRRCPSRAGHTTSLPILPRGVGRAGGTALTPARPRCHAVGPRCAAPAALHRTGAHTSGGPPAAARRRPAPAVPDTTAGPRAPRPAAGRIQVHARLAEPDQQRAGPRRQHDCRVRHRAARSSIRQAMRPTGMTVRTPRASTTTKAPSITSS